MQFRPGQWLDVLIRGLPHAGGFTITSAPQDAKPSAEPTQRDGYLELAIQKSPRNPPAAWLWQEKAEILGSNLLVRVGGNFVWPPPGIDVQSIKRVVFVAGGVGIKYILPLEYQSIAMANPKFLSPLMSILSHLYNHFSQLPSSIRFLYTTRFPHSSDLSHVLFYDRICSMFQSQLSDRRSLDLYLTNGSKIIHPEELKIRGDSNSRIYYRRFSHEDLVEALGDMEERKGVVAYVCGPASMTDEVVKLLRGAEGMEEQRVLCEKWW